MTWSGALLSRKALLPALLLAALLPAASTASVVETGAASAACAAAPPCGYIVPQMALDFPDKPLCKAATLGGEVDLSTCMKLPGPGESVTQNGILRWYWDITQDGTYPIDPQDPIVIAFSGTATNPSYLEIKVEPETFTLDAVAMVHPDNIKTDTNTKQVWFWFEEPITVTITRTAEPNAADIEKAGNAGGVQKVFLKAKSNASGTYFKEAFGVEEFRFNTREDAYFLAADGESQDAPGLGPLALLGVLGVALLALRRRD